MSVKLKHANQQDITEGVIWKQLLTFFFPILLGTFFQQLYNTADAIIVGNYVGTNALAAVGGATGTIINLIVGFFIGLSSGATVILAQFFGARQNENVSRSVHTAIALSLYGGIVITVVGYLLTPAMLTLLDTPEEVKLHAIPYMRIYFIGVIPNLIYNIGSGLLRAVGDSRRPLYFLVAACMANIVLDVFFVLGLKAGVQGAALATILSQLISAVLVLVTLHRSNASYKLHFKKIRFDFGILRSIVKIGLPAGIQSVLFTISNLLIQSTVNSFGTVIMAAWTAYGKLDSMFWMVSNAFGVAMTTFAGQNFGAGKFDRVRRAVWVCGGMYVASAALISLILNLFSGTLFGLFTGEADVIAYGNSIVRHLTPFFFTYVLVEVIACTLRGVGDAVPPMLFTLTGICGLRVVWIMFISRPSGDLMNTLICYPITWAVTGLVFLVYYLQGGWFRRCLKKHEALSRI